MLQLKLCQKCGAKISSPDNYFCHVCGARVEPPPEEKTKSHSNLKLLLTTPNSHPIPKSGSRTVRTVLGILGGLTLLGACIYGGWYQFSKSNPAKHISEPERIPTLTVSLDANWQISNHLLGVSGLDQLTPENVSAYLEGQRADQVLTWLWGEDSLQASLSAYTEYTLEELTSYLEDDFALFERPERQIGFISRVKSVEFWKELLDTIVVKEPLQVELRNGYLIATNSEELLADIDKAGRKVVLSLALSSGFSQSKRKLPPEGQILFYQASQNGSTAFRKLVAATKELGGKGFTVVEEDNGTKVIKPETHQN